MAGAAMMGVETKNEIQGKIVQSRRLLQQVTDPATAHSLKTYLEELEGRLVEKMGAEPPK
jgi:hypothetical protein